MRTIHVVGAPCWQRDAPKSVLCVYICLLACLNLPLLRHARLHLCHFCLGSQLTLFNNTTGQCCRKKVFFFFFQVPTGPPQDVLAQNLTSEKSINVNWSPVLSGHVNGPLLGYSLKYQRIRTAERLLEDTEEHTLTFKPEELSTVLQVKTYSTYRIRVAAFTQKGLGPYSEDVLAGELVEVFTLKYMWFSSFLNQLLQKFTLFISHSAKEIAA